MKNYVRLARIKHWIKNILIFVPAFFGKTFFSFNNILVLLSGFIGFCMSSSAVYVLNDILDAEKDKMHPKKRLRPIASGSVSKKSALIFCLFLTVLSLCITILMGNLFCFFIIFCYISSNILYSLTLKHKPIIETVLIVLGFLLRLLYGACLLNIQVSGWLYLTVMSGAFYMALGKRRGELQKLDKESRRTVLSLYTYNFLDKNMYLFATMTNVFYALWAIGIGVKMYITIPMVIVAFLKYSYDVEQDSFADPMDVFVKDKLIIGISALYVLYSIAVLYFWR